MSFLDELQAFLRDPVLISAEEEKAYRQRFMAALERREREGVNADWLGKAMHNLRPRLSLFAWELTRAFLAEGMERSKIVEGVLRGIDMMLGVVDPTLSGVQLALLRRIQGPLTWMLGTEFSPELDSSRLLPAYAREIRAIGPETSDVQLTPFGRPCLELKGIQAIRWLLHVEVALSTGPRDLWRVDRYTLDQLLGSGDIQFSTPSRYDHDTVDINQSAIWRLTRLDLLNCENEPIGHLRVDGHLVTVYHNRFRPHAHALPILRELAEQEDSPMGVAVAAMINDDTSARLPTPAAPSTSAEAVMRQVRMTAHELRNALVPVQVALDSVWRSPAWDGQDPDRHELRETIDQGIERVFRFVDESTRIAKLAAAPREPFATIPAIDDAVAGLDASSSVTITRNYPETGDSTPLTLGHRSRFVTAILEILRNAAQMASDPVHMFIDVEVPSGTDSVTIIIDDDGPGIPAEKHATIFQNGITYRPGGSGQGLSLAREVIEKEMSGTITCEQSPRGGARFTIQLATYRGETP